MLGVSFTGTYKVPASYNAFEHFCDEKEKQELGYYDVKDGTITFVSNTCIDYGVEKFCRYNGIEYRKLPIEELELRATERRIKEPSPDMKKIRIDSKKLYRVMENQITNIPGCKQAYNNCYNDDVNFILKSGDEFETTTLMIIPSSGASKEDIIFNVKCGNGLEDDSLFFDFEDGDYATLSNYIFFGFEDMGAKDIIVYGDDCTYKIADALGIVVK